MRAINSTEKLCQSTTKSMYTRNLFVEIMKNKLESMLLVQLQYAWSEYSKKFRLRLVHEPPQYEY